MKLVESKAVEGVLCDVVTTEEARQIMRETEVIDDMIKIIKEHDGLGLAAPQVGIKKNFFVMRIEVDTFDIFFNPILVKMDNKRYTEGEGCLNYDGGKSYKQVKRYKKVLLIWEEWDHEKQTLIKQKDVFKNLMARVVQHEMDHLRGKTIFKR